VRVRAKREERGVEEKETEERKRQGGAGRGRGRSGRGGIKGTSEESRRVNKREEANSYKWGENTVEWEGVGKKSNTR